MRNMIRAQIHLTEEQVRALEQVARQQGVSVAELIQQGAERIIKEGGRQDHRQGALASFGRYHDKAADIAVNHNRYLDEAYGSGDIR